MPIAGVLLDAAGTLIRLREPAGATYARVAAQHGVRVPADQVDDAFRRILRGAAPMVFPGAAREETARLERAWWRSLVRGTWRAADQMVHFADFDAYFDTLFAHYATPDAWEAAPGAHEALAELKRAGLRTGVLSNFDHRLPELLDALGLAELLHCVAIPADTGLAKPDPAAFRAALERLGVAAAACVYVGDDPERDLLPARRVGLQAIDVASLATLALLPARIAARGAPHV